MKKIITRVRDDTREFPDFDRGAHFVNTIRGLGVEVSNRRVADLGTGYGSIALACARSGATQVVAVDANPERVQEVARRSDEAGLTVQAVQANLLEPLGDRVNGSVHLAFMLGVVEYAGLWKTDEAVDVLQQRVFRNTYDILEPDGVLILATKNRFWPRYLIRDIHTGQPLVNGLPRRLADFVSQTTSGTPYRQHIHSPSAWMRLLVAAGFNRITCYYPLFSYQFPILVVEKPTFRHAREVASHTGMPDSISAAAYGRFSGPKALLMALAASVRFPLSSTLIIKAEK